MTIDHDRAEAAPSKGGRAGARVSGGRQAWLITGFLTLLLVINYVDKIVTNIAGPDIIADLGLTKSEFGVVQSSFFWLYAVGGILGGWLMARIRPTRLLFGVVVVWAFSLLPLAWPVGFATLVGCRILLGLAEGPTTALTMHIAHTWFPPEKRALPSSVLIAGTSIGPVIGAPTLTWIVTAYDWHTAFAVLAVVGFVVAVLWLLVGREGPESPVKAHGAATTSIELPERAPLLKVFGTGTMIGLTTLILSAYAAVAVKVTWLKLYLQDGLGYTSQAAGNLVALPYLGSAIALVSVGFVSAALTRRGVSSRLARGVLGASLVLGSGLAMLAFAPLEAGAPHMALLILSACLNSAGLGIVFAAISDVAPPGQRGIVLAIVSAVFSLGGVITPLVLGRVVDAAATPADGYTTSFVIVAVTMVIGAIVALLTVNPERDARKLAALRTEPTA
ncbi:MFS transporter [Streptomyces sp. NPDC005963]|uniref:MFS transporter n=1 Tax=Streptomyces sp. NPDC005963 TaxID=3156721 RepID=UPI0033F9370B